MDLESGEMVLSYLSITAKFSTLDKFPYLSVPGCDVLFCTMGIKVSSLSRLSLALNETTHMHAFINLKTNKRSFLSLCIKAKNE